MGFSRQEYSSGLPLPFPGDLPDPGIKPRSPAFQADALTSEPPGKPTNGKMSVTSEDKEDISGNPLLLVSQVRPMELGDSTAIMEPPNNPTVIPTVANEGGKHWTVPEVRALIGIWSDQGIQQQLEGTMRNKRIFEQIAAKLQKLGIERDWKQCRTKYKNLKHEYKIVRTARDLGMAKSMKFFTELDAILGDKKTENSQQESQNEEQATGCAHVKMEEDQTVIAGDAAEDDLVSNMSEDLRETVMRQSPCTEEDTASNASDEVGGPTAPHGIPGSELFENHTKNPRTLSIKRKALEDEPASVSLKKTASETAANQFPQRTTEPKDSSEYFCSQETPYVTQLHQSPASLPNAAETPRPLRTMAAVEVLKIGKKLYEGKTKEVYELLDSPGRVLLQSKDQITAGNAARKNHLEGKAAISNKITSCIFQLLQEAGIKTAFTRKCGETAFIAPKCEMIPIEWVCRRIATGSFLKRNPGVKEGYKFYPPKVEMFFKDDANNDPQWSEEQLIAANFCFAGLVIGQTEVDIMRHATQAIFEILEKSWLPQNCTLVDMKIEFGVDVTTREIVLADVIDNDSWRLWPSGDRSQQKDKQSYRDLKEVTPEGLQMVKKNFEWVAERIELLLKPESQCRVIVLMGSTSDLSHCEKIKKACGTFGIPCELRVTSAHKGPDETLRIKAEYEGDGIPTVFVAVAGRSNGLGPVLSGNTAYPVISCPPLTPDWGAQDVWSSLRLPSGLGCSTILSPEGSAQFAAQIFGLNNHLIWARLRASVLNTWISLKQADKKIREANL
ncbi:bifunctional phosphoribosylaminoimidazole carboxylase/phosphoribosylaminoimidazole succinocarboxamide synthetase isoform X7 [Ovis aries]|uniref:bifunctional phosphoribosylaminoimidazole carboxylase/phosphoribosylaminoimidazole succinocarboxamide synthetase isoform X7 n=1 Tax=Ovis aries TaxID=9940 RepID=UPI0029527687|nr:bifunctional phosphoribosylaminoimidazole carboxylase/phosphoribosylaminoimidazole succinocarboxamide synthetase isoform X7 [Ovis aries]